MHDRRTALPLVLALATAGCAHTRGPPDAPARARELRPGVSTLADARALLGEPSAARDHGAMGTCYTWTYEEARWGSTQKREFLFLCFDTEGALTPGLPAPPAPGWDE